MDGSRQQQTPCTHTSWRARFDHGSATGQALLRSQGGPLSGVPYSCFPTSALARFDSTQFRVLLLRRLWLSSSSIFSQVPVCPSPGRPWPPPWGVGSSRFCAGVSHCQCAAWSVTWIWCFRADRTVAGSRWLLGLPLFHGAQLAIDATLVSSVGRNGKQ